MTKYGYLEGGWVVPGIVPLPAHPGIPTPGTPPPHPPLQGPYVTAAAGHAGRRNSAVGLISVGQLSLYVHISRFRGMTEVYNLSKIGRIINHLFIAGNK